MENQSSSSWGRLSSLASACTIRTTTVSTASAISAHSSSQADALILLLSPLAFCLDVTLMICRHKPVLPSQYFRMSRSLDLCGPTWLVASMQRHQRCICWFLPFFLCFLSSFLSHNVIGADQIFNGFMPWFGLILPFLGIKSLNRYFPVEIG